MVHIWVKCYCIIPFQTLLVKSLKKKNFPATRKVDFEKTTLIQLRLTYRGTSHLLSLTSSLAANEKDAWNIKNAIEIKLFDISLNWKGWVSRATQSRLVHESSTLNCIELADHWNVLTEMKIQTILHNYLFSNA